MDTLTIQDAFEPYYAGRKRVAKPRDRRLAAKPESTPGQEPAARTLPASVELSETDSTTEH